MISLESGRDILIIWIAVCAGVIAEYFVNDVSIIIIVISVACVIAGFYLYLRKGT